MTIIHAVKALALSRENFGGGPLLPASNKCSARSSATIQRDRAHFRSVPQLWTQPAILPSWPRGLSVGSSAARRTSERYRQTDSDCCAGRCPHCGHRSNWVDPFPLLPRSRPVGQKIKKVRCQIQKGLPPLRKPLYDSPTDPESQVDKKPGSWFLPRDLWHPKGATRPTARRLESLPGLPGHKAKDR